MPTRFRTLSLLRNLLLSAALSTAMISTVISANENAQPAGKTNDDLYVEMIVTMLRSHIAAMRLLIDHEYLHYADNVARHATAFERTFGMIGPMEWHAADAFARASKVEGAAVSEAQFASLGEDSFAAIHALPRAAERYQRDKNKELMHESINQVISSCIACHSSLPPGSVPDVWAGMTP